MALIAFFSGESSSRSTDLTDPVDDDLTWGELWAIEKRDRPWLWTGNLVLVCWGVGQFASTLL